MTKKTKVNEDLSTTAPIKRCKAHKKDGSPCQKYPIAGAEVCRFHGGAAKQVRAKATERLMSMVMPALSELDKILRRQGTSDADRLKAIREVLGRTGFSESQILALTPVEDPWGPLFAAQLESDDPAAQVARARLERMGQKDEPLAIGSSVSDFPDVTEDDIGQLNNNAMRNANRDTDDRNSYLSDDGHDLVRGEVINDGKSTRARKQTSPEQALQDGDYSPVGRNGQRLANTDEPSEFDPAPTRKRTDNKSARTKRQRYLQEMGEQDGA